MDVNVGGLDHSGSVLPCKLLPELFSFPAILETFKLVLSWCCDCVGILGFLELSFVLLLKSCFLVIFRLLFSCFMLAGLLYWPFHFESLIHEPFPHAYLSVPAFLWNVNSLSWSHFPTKGHVDNWKTSTVRILRCVLAPPVLWNWDLCRLETEKYPRMPIASTMTTMMTGRQIREWKNPVENPGKFQNKTPRAARPETSR